MLTLRGEGYGNCEQPCNMVRVRVMQKHKLHKLLHGDHSIKATQPGEQQITKQQYQLHKFVTIADFMFNTISKMKILSVRK